MVATTEAIPTPQIHFRHLRERSAASDIGGAGGSGGGWGSMGIGLSVVNQNRHDRTRMEWR